MSFYGTAIISNFRLGFLLLPFCQFISSCCCVGGGKTKFPKELNGIFNGTIEFQPVKGLSGETV